MTAPAGILPKKLSDDSTLGHEATLALVAGLIRALGEAEIGRVDDPFVQAASRRELEAFINGLDAALPWSSEVTGFPVSSGGVMRYCDLREWARRTPGMVWGKTTVARIVFALVGDELTPGGKDAATFAQERIDEIARQCKVEHGGKLTRVILEKHLEETFGLSTDRVRKILKGAGGVRSVYRRIGHQETRYKPKW
jgi:hypothetical protein